MELEGNECGKWILIWGNWRGIEGLLMRGNGGISGKSSEMMRWYL